MFSLPYRTIGLCLEASNHPKEENVVFFFRKSSCLKGISFIDLIIAYDLIKSILEKITYLDYN